MAGERILVVEDEKDIQELVRYNLEKHGFEVVSATTGEDGVAAARRRDPKLVLLDIMLPGMDGLDVCRALKGDPKTAGIPVIMLTAKGEEPDVVAGLELGARDYVTKPFSPRVLVARVRAALRGPAPGAPEGGGRIEVHDIVIDPERRRVEAGGRPVELTFTEFGVLRVLAARPGRVFTRYEIVDGVRGEAYPVTERAVDVQIVGLRRKLGRCGRYIETVRGVGYRMKE
jgi:two-component system phosphate regulon response regulator PhoB